MSKQYENDLARAIYDATPSRVRTYRCGHSGNNAMPQPDILVTDVAENHALEVKGPIQSEQCYVDEEDIDQLIECQNGHTAVYLVVKFSRRTPLVIRYFEEVSGSPEYNNYSPMEKFVALCPPAFNARVTESDILALDKPSTEDWPSARGGPGDVASLVSGLGIATPDSVSVEL